MFSESNICIFPIKFQATLLIKGNSVVLSFHYVPEVYLFAYVRQSSQFSEAIRHPNPVGRPAVHRALTLLTDCPCIPKQGNLEIRTI